MIKERIVNQSPDAQVMTERHLSMSDLADREGVPLQTVRGWRTKGYGPRGMAVGRHVRYRLSDVIAWEDAQIDAYRQGIA